MAPLRSPRRRGMTAHNWSWAMAEPRTLKRLQESLERSPKIKNEMLLQGSNTLVHEELVENFSVALTETSRMLTVRPVSLAM